MNTETRSTIFKVFIAIVVLIIAYFAYIEIRRLLIARKVKQEMEKTAEKTVEIVDFIQDDSTEK